MKLDRLAEMVEALTDAPWVAVSDDAVWGIAVDDRVGDGSTVADLMSGRDARAIAALRNVAPELIAVAQAAARVRGGTTCFRARRNEGADCGECTACLGRALDAKLAEVPGE